MATFEAQVNGITNLGIDGTSTDPGQTELTQFLKDGVIDVTNKIVALRPQDIENFQRESATIDSNSGLDVGGAKIISVIREAGADGSSDGSTAWEPCGKIPASMQSKVVDIDSLYYASQYHPKYIIDDNGKVNVYPVASANNGYKVFFVNNVPTDETNEIALVYSHSDIKWFPNDKVYLVVIYAGIKSLQASLAAVDITTFSLTAGLPVPPDSITDTITSFSLAGEFDDAMAKAKALIDDAGSLSQGQDAEYWLNDEDPEMIASTVQVASQELQRANLGLQDALQTFNTDMQKFQASGTGKFSAEVAAYQAELVEYQAEVAAEIQTYQQELAEKSAEYQWKAARLQDLKQEYNQAFAIMAPPQAQQQQAQRRAG
jgi:hypothetical protein